MSSQGSTLNNRARVSSSSVVFAVVFLALLVRFVHLLHVYPTPILSYHRMFVESDMYMFDQWAQRIAKGDVLGREVYHPLNGWQLGLAPKEKWSEWYGEAPVFYKAPFYAYLVALLYWLFGDAILPLLLLQIGASAASVVLLLRTGDRLFDASTGFAAALLLALYAPDVHYDTIMLRGP